MIRSRRVAGFLALRHYGVSAFTLIALILVATGWLSAQNGSQQAKQTLTAPPPKYHVLSPNFQHASPGRTTMVLQPATSPTLSQSTWTAIGPASLSGGGGSYSGRIVGIAVDPTSVNNIYIAAAGGGVWQTTNAGTAWNPLTDNQATLAMGAIAIAPSNHLKIYAGTGEANNALDSNFGLGILISNDGGATWSLSQGPSNIFSSNRLVVGEISVDPTNPSTAYAAVGLAGENGVFNAEGGTGIYKTTDGGTTWTNTTTSINEVTLDGTFTSTFSWSAVVVDPNTPTTVYAAHGYNFSFHNYNSANGVYRSLNGGSTWTLLTNTINGATNSDTGRIALAVAPSASTANNHVLYVAAEAVSTGGLLYFERSDNADSALPTFTTSLTAGTPDFGGAENSVDGGSGQGWYDWVIGVDPANSAVVYAAGVECYDCGGTQAVIRSTTSGTSWDDISIVGGIEPHTDNHAIAFDSSSRMYLGNDGGIWRFDPTVPSWTNLNSNLNTIQFTGIGLHPSSSTTVLGGSQDNGTELYTGNVVWSQTDGGDGGFAQISQTLGTRCYHTYTGASFVRSDSSCASGTWVSKTSGILNGNANFYAPYTVDPTNGDHLLFGGDRVYETTNAADSWTAISAPGSNGFNSGGKNINAVAIAPGTNMRYATVCCNGSSEAQVFITTNDGTSWTESDLPVTGRVDELDVDPNDSSGNTVIAVINQFNAAKQHVFRTNNGGTSWSNISGNLPNVPTWSAKIDTDASQTIYVSNETGVYSSPSPYTTWTAYGTGLPDVQGVHLELNRTLHVLAVGTHGRGAWEILTPGAGGPPPAAIIAVAPTSPISAQINSNFSPALQVKVTDASNNPVSGATVTFSGPVSGASATFTTPALTDSNGLTSVTATANGIVGGPYTVSASVSGVATPANFSLSNTAPPPPTVVSVSPGSGTGNPQSFTFTYSDVAGYTDLSSVYAVFNSTVASGLNGCYFYYLPASNVLYLKADNGSTNLAALTPGGAGSDSNSQCSVSASGISVGHSGTNLTLTVGVTFTSTFTGKKTVYMRAISSGGTSGFVAKGTWSAAANQAPAIVSMSPNSGTGNPQSFTFTYSDPNGWTDLGSVYLLFNSTIATPLNGCYMYYVPAVNTLYLRGDNGVSTAGALTPGGAGSASNSQCSVAASGISVAPSGNNLALTVSINFASTFTGLKHAYLRAIDNSSADSHYVSGGTWSAATNQTPTVVSVSPSSGSGFSQTFTFTYADANGWNDLASVYALFSGTPFSTANACYMYYQPAVNLFYLRADNGTSNVGSLAPGTAVVTMSNSQCSVAGSTVSVGHSGTNLTLTVTVNFTGGFTGQKTVDLRAIDNSNADSHFVSEGTWTP
ncbi:MAG TPA: hypothetical protein VFA04_21315 [Bryobacteraceae bacterium]|nr:hypothetical protein [Bryobacteraceae bacterium]